jgi:hypothetical protein
VAAIARALKQVKGLFNKGGNEEQVFQSEMDNAGTAASAPSMIPEKEDAFTYDEPASEPPSYSPQTMVAPPQSVTMTTRSFAPTPAIRTN